MTGKTMKYGYLMSTCSPAYERIIYGYDLYDTYEEAREALLESERDDEIEVFDIDEIRQLLIGDGFEEDGDALSMEWHDETYDVDVYYHVSLDTMVCQSNLGGYNPDANMYKYDSIHDILDILRSGGSIKDGDYSPY
jgi:hypothetical protein